MSASRTLFRKLDLELIARLESGVKHTPKPIKKVKEPREAASYRGAIRNHRRTVRAAQLEAKRSALQALLVPGAKIREEA